ncbi:hypothetical protein [Nocardia sp. NBC_01329]|uniref:hypothetical protein n=1 Tax=Nocardia sp. NBC_01329 TaxID=2903594 RepID=UPI002E130151|nr:hypothetical protein OG405_28915 [Nocardia sp. NBC_01329]
MSNRISKLFAASTIALALGFIAAPAASATAEPVAPVTGSVVICIPLGSASICF